MTCVSIIKWFVLVLVMVSKNQSNKTKTDFLLPRFELGMVDSKSTVITTSLQEKHKNGTLSFKRTLARHRQDSNLRGRSPVDFESTSLTTRTRCHKFNHSEIAPNVGIEPTTTRLRVVRSAKLS
jgi:hypothetical protein